MELIKIEGNKRYYVTKCGKIYSNYRGKLNQMTPATKKGYEKLTLAIDGKRHTKYVHRLVGYTYIDNPENKREINHINGIKTDNRVENLEWCTRLENVQHSVRTGLSHKESMPKEVCQYTLNGVLVKKWKSIYEAGQNGYSEKAISSCINNRINSHAEHLWGIPKKIDHVVVK